MHRLRPKALLHMEATTKVATFAELLADTFHFSRYELIVYTEAGVHHRKVRGKVPDQLQRRTFGPRLRVFAKSL